MESRTSFAHTYIHTYILIVLTLLSLNLHAQEIPPQLQPPTYEVKIDPKGTYLYFNTNPESENSIPDNANSPSTFDLKKMYDDPVYPLKAGDLIRFELFGYYKPGTTFTDTYAFLIGVFSDSAVYSKNARFLPYGPQTTAPPYVTPLTWYDSKPTDIAQDFSIPHGYVVYAQVPEGARSIFFTTSSSFYAEASDPNGDFKVTLKMRVVRTDLSTSSIQLPTAKINPTDNIPALSVDSRHEVKAEVSLVGVLDQLNMYAMVPVTLSIGNLTQTQWVSALELGQVGSVPVSFWINPTSDDVGLYDLKITVNPEKSFEETSFENNQVIQQVRVMGKYKILKTILYDDVVVDKYNQVKNPHFFEMRPTFDVRNATHCKPEKKFIPSVARIKLECIKDDGSFERVNDCQVQLKKTLGNFWGGHSDQVAAGDNRSHNNESRPLGYFATIDKQLFNIDKEYKTIPKEGLTFGYVAPDPSGEVVLSFDAKSPEGIQFLVPRSTVQVKIGGLVRIDDLLNLEMIETGHFGLSDTNRKTEEGVYVTPRFKQQMRAAIAEYYTQSIKAGIPENQIISLRSEAASLVWGGLYDIMHNWQPSHCGHRVGNALDIGMGVFKSSSSQYEKQLRTILNDVLVRKKFWFPVDSEGPKVGNKKHWHTQLK